MQKNSARRAELFADRDGLIIQFTLVGTMMRVTKVSKFVMQFCTLVARSAWMARALYFLLSSSRRWHLRPWVSLRLLLSGHPVDLFVVWCCARCGIRSSILRSKASPMRNHPSLTWDSRWHIKLNKIRLSMCLDAVFRYKDGCELQWISLSRSSTNKIKYAIHICLNNLFENHFVAMKFYCYVRKNTVTFYYVTNAWLRREHIEVGIADFDEIWHNCSFRKNIRPGFFFLIYYLFVISAMVDVEGVKTTLKVVKHILLNISEIIKDIVFV